MRAERAVEPTKSENITVTWRRSAESARGCVYCRRTGTSRRCRAFVSTQSCDGIEELDAMPECCDAKLFQVLRRQARKNRLVYLILAECCLILPEAQAPQPDHNVHSCARNRG